MFGDDSVVIELVFLREVLSLHDVAREGADSSEHVDDPVAQLFAHLQLHLGPSQKETTRVHHEGP